MFSDAVAHLLYLVCYPRIGGCVFRIICFRIHIDPPINAHLLYPLHNTVITFWIYREGCAVILMNQREGGDITGTGLYVILEPLSILLKEYSDRAKIILKFLLMVSVHPFTELINKLFSHFIHKTATDTWHALRYTYATRCIENKVDVKSLSGITGHADVKVTRQRSVHPSMDAQKPDK